MLNFIRRIKKKIIFQIYHRFLSRLSAYYYRNPSREIIVIGVTGTNGKTTTSYLISKALESMDIKTGLSSTAIFKIGEKEWLNDTKMTMLGRFQLQKMLRQMVDAGCRYAVIETSSQGIEQFRHIDINYDIGIFTNLTPEHIESHGGFDNYKKAKIKLFQHIAESPIKTIDGKKIKKTFVLNKDDSYSSDFAVKDIPVIWYGIESLTELQATQIKETEQGLSFQINNTPINLQFFGKVNVYNVLASLGAVQALSQNQNQAIQNLEQIKTIPGRFEKIDVGQDWKVIVDYAPEPESMRRLYESLEIVPHNRIIHVLGSCGGGRDKARRPILGQLSGQKADIVIITNEDPYDDDPQEIINNVAEGARKVGKIDNQNLFTILDRREAIEKAMSLAQKDDLVLITGKGSEQKICVANGQKISWDDRQVAREVIKKYFHKS